MSYVTMRNCAFSYKCSKSWSDLEDTEDESIRFCRDCQREVYFCADDDELLSYIRLNRCVAFWMRDGTELLGSVVYSPKP